VRTVDVAVLDANHSKWRIAWDSPAASGAACDAAMRVALAHAELRAVLPAQEAVEARLLAALAPNDPPLRRRA